MPGFLMFEEYGIKDEGMMADLAKTALRRLPMAWIAHGIKGEYNIDVDPVAILRGDGTDLLNLGEAYAAWISVTSIDQTIQGAANRDEDDLEEQREQVRNSAENGTDSGSRRQSKTRMKKEKDDGRGRMSVTIEIDASLTQLIKGALEKDDKGAPKIFDSAEVHMCTTAQIDLSALTAGNGPAAGLIKTLAAALLFNIIPYLTIIMKKVTIESINFNIQGESGQSAPTATLSLKFQKVKWVYHIINQSNMNLIDMTADYDYKARDKQKPSGLSLGVGTVVNPFG